VTGIRTCNLLRHQDLQNYLILLRSVMMTAVLYVLNNQLKLVIGLTGFFTLSFFSNIILHENIMSEVL